MKLSAGGTDDNDSVILAYRQTRAAHALDTFLFFFLMPLTASRRDTLGAAGCFVSNHTLQKSEWGQACVMEGSCIIL